MSKALSNVIGDDPFSITGPATKKKAIIQGVVAGVPVLLLIALILKLTRRPKAALRGEATRTLGFFFSFFIFLGKYNLYINI